MEAYVGQIQLFAFNFAPRNWAFCNGQILAISTNTALFSILGTYYGGNGTTTFALPDLRGVTHWCQNQSTGDPVLGQLDGSETVTLDPTQLTRHNHPFNASTTQGDSSTAAGRVLATCGINPGRGQPYQGTTLYSPVSPITVMAPQNIAFSGGNQPHNNMQPYLTLNFCICLAGTFPPRN